MFEKNSVKNVIGLIGAKILLDLCVFLTWDVQTYLFSNIADTFYWESYS